MIKMSSESYDKESRVKRRRGKLKWEVKDSDEEWMIKIRSEWLRRGVNN